jgi:hypothetical protein
MNNSSNNDIRNWVYAKDEHWVELDKVAQESIETLWEQNNSSYITSPSFDEPVFIDINQMVLVTDKYQHTIVRRPSTTATESEEEEKTPS